MEEDDARGPLFEGVLYSVVPSDELTATRQDEVRLHNSRVWKSILTSDS